MALMSVKDFEHFNTDFHDSKDATDSVENVHLRLVVIGAAFATHTSAVQ